MTTYKRGSRWYYDFMIRGTRHRAAIPEARTRAQAERAETQAREDVYNRRYTLPGESITLGRFYSEIYLPWAKDHKRSWKTDDLRLQPALATFGKLPLADIAPLHIERWKRERRDTPAKRGRGPNASIGTRSPGTVNHELASLASVFSLAVQQELLASNPVRKVKKLPHNSERSRVCSVEEEQLLRAWLPKTIVPFFVVAINTGMRCGEMVALNWDDVDFQTDTIHIRTSKTGRPRTIPMNQAVRAEISRLFNQRKSDQAVFCNQHGTRHKRPNVTFYAYCKKLGIVDLHWHDLRHTAASRLADAGASAFVIAEILGHADLRQTKRYTHATSDAKRRAVEAISDYTEKDCRKIVSIAERRKAG